MLSIIKYTSIHTNLHMPITLIRIGLKYSSLVPRPSQPPGFDCLQHANTEGEGFAYTLHLVFGARIGDLLWKYVKALSLGAWGRVFMQHLQ